VPRRIPVEIVTLGPIAIDPREAHHLRDVLRLSDGSPVEVFDHAGNVGIGRLTIIAGAVTASIESILPAKPPQPTLIITSAVPKAARADWMVEKLSEVGVDIWIPLATDRSVSLPEGKNKIERWDRLASEAAKQSHRRGCMRIEPLTTLASALQKLTNPTDAWCLSTEPASRPLHPLEFTPARSTATLFIGPEGGWTPSELAMFTSARIPAISLMDSILRIETAAIAAAVLFRMHLNAMPAPES
jgi:16S rRNA (uracil1498-N3)-methyltransferase